METKIFVINFPTMGTVAETINSILDGAFCCESKNDKARKTRCCEDDFEDFVPSRFRDENEFCKEPIRKWGIKGEPADKNKIFGAEFAVDEPKRSNYDERWKFESDHAAFDRFVEAGEDCVARGLSRPDGVTTHKCNAIRQRVDEIPPMDIDLIGETEWWDEDLDWNF